MNRFWWFAFILAWGATTESGKISGYKIVEAA